MKLVWRNTKTDPAGEIVDLDAYPATPGPRDQPEVSYGCWVASSFELLSGTEISEERDTVAGELFDELFAPQSAAAKGSGKA